MVLKNLIGTILLILGIGVLTSCSDFPTIDIYTLEGDTVKIGSQTWTAGNLNITTEDCIKLEDCTCYDYNEENCEKYGALYTFEGSKAVCEDLGSDWRLPSNDDWKTLIEHFGENSAEKLKSKKESGFSAMLGGYYWDKADGFNVIGEEGYYRSSTEDGVPNTYAMKITKGGKEAEIISSVNKNSFASVRCVK